MSSKKSRERELQDKTAIAGRIKQALGSREQKWLSEQTGEPKSVISDYINGRRRPGPDKVANLARALGCDFLWLLTGEEPAEAPKEITLPGRPGDIPVEVWEEILPLLSELAAIYEARGIPEHAPLWGAIRINIQTFANQVRRDTRLEGPDHRPKPRRRSDSPKS